MDEKEIEFLHKLMDSGLVSRLEGILDEYDKANDKFEKNEWHNKYAEKLGPYEDKLKILNGDDFNIFDESLKEYKETYSDVEADEYIDSLENNIKEVLGKVEAAFGPEKAEELEEKIEPIVEEAKEEVKEEETEPEEETETQPEVPDETEPKAETETEVEVKEEPEVEAEIEVQTEEEPVDAIDEIEEFIAELKNSPEYKHDHPEEKEEE